MKGKLLCLTVSQVKQRVSLVRTPSKMLCTQVRGLFEAPTVATLPLPLPLLAVSVA